MTNKAGLDRDLLVEPGSWIRLGKCRPHQVDANGSDRISV
jgi:hypothetical protein